jgi:hypothetical protein
MGEMFRRLALCVVLSAVAHGATVRLYLKDGSFHAVSEYKKLMDRVRYYSTERGEWEEIPLDLVDLKRTEEEITARDTSRKEEAAMMEAEDRAVRAQRREIERIPMEAGVFMVEGEKVNTLQQAESKVVNNKRRSILKAVTPIPILAGKATVELDGPKSTFVLTADRPEFYIRLASEERFAIVRLAPGKTSRVVQKWNIIPVSKEIVEETDIIETFRQQLADGLYKIWPTKPLAPGEYAVVEYTEGKGNIQVWDFSIAPK